MSICLLFSQLRSGLVAACVFARHLTASQCSEQPDTLGLTCCAGSTPFLRSGSTAQMQTPSASALGRGIRGMAAFDAMPESPLDIDAQAGLNATPGTVSKLLVGPVLQETICNMSTAPLAEV